MEVGRRWRDVEQVEVVVGVEEEEVEEVEVEDMEEEEVYI